MKQNSTIKKRNKGFLAMILSMFMFVTCAATTVPAYAQNVATAKSNFIFENSLVMEEDVYTPEIKFEYSITAGNAKNASTGSPAISAGNVEGVTLSDATYTSDDKGAQLEGEAVVMKDVTVTFPENKFTAPGIYRYIITLNNPNHPGITIDSDPSRVLDVYVKYESDSSNKLIISDYVLHSNNQESEDENPNTVAKSLGFSNLYTTYDLTLEKQVTGNQGDRDKYFDFNVEITNAIPNTVYTVETLNNGEDHNNPVSLTVGEDGSVSGGVELKDDGSVVIKGLTSDIKYQITEKSYANEGYETSYQIGSTASVKNNSTPDEVTIGTDDVEVTFTNTKAGVVPTGIINEFGPFVLLGAGVLGGFVLLISSRRRRDY